MWQEQRQSIHGAPLGGEEMELFLNEVNWNGDVFEHDDDVYEYFAEKRLEDEKKYEDWKSNLDKKLKNDESFKIMWNQFCTNELILETLSLTS